MTIYYKIIIIWCKYPFQDVIDEKYVEFYQRVKNKFIRIDSLKMESNTSIKEKEEYLKTELSIKKVNIVKLK